MHPVVFLLATLVRGVVNVNASGDGKHGVVSFNASPCVYPTANEEFAAAFYSTMVVDVGPQKLKKFVLPGSTVAIQEYEVVTDILSDLCNAGEIAYFAARGIGLVANKTLKRYIKETAFDVADFLYDQEKLRCDNAVTLGLKFFKDVKDGLRGLDLQQYKSYQRGIDTGVRKFVTGLGYKVPDVVDIFVGVVDQDYVFENYDVCPDMADQKPITESQ